MKRFLRIAARILPWVVIGAVAIFFWRAITSNLDSLRDVEIAVDGWLVGSIVLFTLAVVVSGMLWGRMLTDLSGKRVSIADSVRIHCASWVLKYIPGQVGSYLNKIAWAGKAGLSKKTVTNSFIYENVLMVIASLILSLPVVLMFRDVVDANLGLFVPVLAAIPMLVIFWPGAFNRMLNLLLGLMKKEPFRDSDFMSPLRLGGYQLGYLLPRLLNGVGFVLVAHSMVGVEPEWWVGMAATYILASIIGMLAIFVPGGLGVREAVAVALLSVYLPVAQAIVVTLVARLCATISDALVALVYFVLNKGRLRQQ